MISLDKQKVTQAIEKVLNTSKIGVLSTAYNNKPNSRYMVFYNDGINLFIQKIELNCNKSFTKIQLYFN